MTVVRESALDRPATTRVRWIDTTRAAAVTAVVLFHICIWQFLPVLRDAAPSGNALRLWDLVNGVIGGLRMPVLLALSGLLVGRRVAQGFHATRRGVVANLYLYVVWLTVYVAFSAAVRSQIPQRVEGLPDYFNQLLVPRTTLWYVLALAVYVLLLTALRGVPSWAVLGGLAIISVLAFTYPPGIGMWGKIAGLMVYFALGVRAGPLLRRSAERARPVLTAAAVGVCVVLIYADRFAPNRLSQVTFGLIRNAIVIVTAVAVVALVARWRPLGAVGAYLGQRTLGVYVIHALMAQLLVVFAAGPAAGLVSSVAASTVLSLCYPPVMTVAVIVVCLGLDKGLRRMGAGWLFVLPNVLRTRLERSAPPTSRDVSK